MAGQLNFDKTPSQEHDEELNSTHQSCWSASNDTPISAGWVTTLLKQCEHWWTALHEFWKNCLVHNLRSFFHPAIPPSETVQFLDNFEYIVHTSQLLVGEHGLKTRFINKGRPSGDNVPPNVKSFGQRAFSQTRKEIITYGVICLLVFYCLHFHPTFLTRFLPSFARKLIILCTLGNSVLVSGSRWCVRRSRGQALLNLHRLVDSIQDLEYVVNKAYSSIYTKELHIYFKSPRSEVPSPAYEKRHHTSYVAFSDVTLHQLSCLKQAYHSALKKLHPLTSPALEQLLSLYRLPSSEPDAEESNSSFSSPVTQTRVRHVASLSSAFDGSSSEEEAATEVLLRLRAQFRDLVVLCKQLLCNMLSIQLNGSLQEVLVWESVFQALARLSRSLRTTVGTIQHSAYVSDYVAPQMEVTESDSTTARRRSLCFQQNRDLYSFTNSVQRVELIMSFILEGFSHLLEEKTDFRTQTHAIATFEEMGEKLKKLQTQWESYRSVMNSLQATQNQLRVKRYSRMTDDSYIASEDEGLAEDAFIFDSKRFGSLPSSCSKDGVDDSSASEDMFIAAESKPFVGHIETVTKAAVDVVQDDLSPCVGDRKSTALDVDSSPAHQRRKSQSFAMNTFTVVDELKSVLPQRKQADKTHLLC